MSKKLIVIISSAVIAIAVIGVVLVLVLSSVGKGTKEKSSDGAVNNSGVVYSKDPSDNAGSGYGDTVRIPIKVTENPGMIAAKTVISYDSSVFEYVDCESGFFKDCQAKAKDGKVVCLMTGDFSSSSADVKSIGTAATLVFKIKSSAKAGKYFITLEKDESQYADLSEKFVHPTVTIPSEIVIK